MSPPPLLNWRSRIASYDSSTTSFGICIQVRWIASRNMMRASDPQYLCDELTYDAHGNEVEQSRRLKIALRSTMESSTQQLAQKKVIVRPTGLAEALWACVLDDYLSEEEEGEFVKILGTKEIVPWYLKNEVACAPIEPSKHAIADDPRDVRARGGRDLDSTDDERDGTPGVWNDEDVSHTEMPPVLWLSVPPAEATTLEPLKKERDWVKKEPDWDAGTTDWDMSVQSYRIKKQLKGERLTFSGKVVADSRQFRTSSRVRSRGLIRGSEEFPRTSSRVSTRSRSVNAAATTSSPRSRNDSPLKSSRVRTASRTGLEVQSRAPSRVSSEVLTRSRSTKSAKSNSRSTRKIREDGVESRHPNHSRRGESPTKRQRSTSIPRSRTMSPSRHESLPSPKSPTKKKQSSSPRKMSLKRRT